jgi:hypothetical protein
MKLTQQRQLHDATVNARPRHAAVEKRMLELKKYSEEADNNRIEWAIDHWVSHERSRIQL